MYEIGCPSARTVADREMGHFTEEKMPYVHASVDGNGARILELRNEPRIIPLTNPSLDTPRPFRPSL